MYDMCVRVRVRVCICVCVCERERERESERLSGRSISSEDWKKNQKNLRMKEIVSLHRLLMDYL
jgi:hypothetical protein